MVNIAIARLTGRVMVSVGGTKCHTKKTGITIAQALKRARPMTHGQTREDRKDEDGNMTISMLDEAKKALELKKAAESRMETLKSTRAIIIGSREVPLTPDELLRVMEIFEYRRDEASALLESI